MASPSRIGTALVGGGVLLLVLTFAVGGALAPNGAADAALDDGDADLRHTLVGVQGVGSYHEGGYVAMVEGREVAWREDSSETYFDVTRLENGSVLAAFMTGGNEECGPYDSPCARTGFRILEPGPDPRVRYEWSFPVRTRQASEVHDVESLPDGGFLVADMEHERVIVVRDGRIEWEWHASSFYEAPDDPTTKDWLHINDVDRIGEGRYLVSVRNANQLVVIERGEGVVDVINEDRDGTDESCLGPWKLEDQNGDGEVRCGDPDVLRHQHNPQWLGEGAVLVADSENHRVVELHRTGDGRWEPAWTLTRADGKKLDWPRDADRLPNGNTLVTDTRNARVLEVNESGSVVWSHRMDYRTLPYEADRLPGGESVGAERYATETPAPNSDTVVVLTPLLRLVSAGVRLPLWFREGHLLVALVSLLSVGSGAVTLAADRWRS